MANDADILVKNGRLFPLGHLRKGGTVELVNDTDRTLEFEFFGPAGDSEGNPDRHPFAEDPEPLPPRSARSLAVLGSAASAYSVFQISAGGEAVGGRLKIDVADRGFDRVRYQAYEDGGPRVRVAVHAPWPGGQPYGVGFETSPVDVHATLEVMGVDHREQETAEPLGEVDLTPDTPIRVFTIADPTPYRRLRVRFAQPGPIQSGGTDQADIIVDPEDPLQPPTG